MVKYRTNKLIHSSIEGVNKKCHFKRHYLHVLVDVRRSHLLAFELLLGHQPHLLLLCRCAVHAMSCHRLLLYCPVTHLGAYSEGKQTPSKPIYDNEMGVIHIFMCAYPYA